jgi:hypothetical protein
MYFTSVSKWVFCIEILVLERVSWRWSSKHFGQIKLVKSPLISTLDKVIYYKGTFLQASTKPLFTTQNRWRPFFNMLFLVLGYLCFLTSFPTDDLKWSTNFFED